MIVKNSLSQLYILLSQGFSPNFIQSEIRDFPVTYIMQLIDVDLDKNNAE